MYIRILSVSTAALLIGACTPRTVEPRIGAFRIDTLLGDTVRGCNVECVFTSILNPDDSHALGSIQQANIGYFFNLEDFTGSVEEAAEILLRELTDENDLSDGVYELSAGSEITVTDTLLTFVIGRWSYLGGAHGMYGTECHTYSLADGGEYFLADLFDERQQEKLDEAIRCRIRETYRAADDQALSEAGFFPEYIAATENFILTKEGITFYFNPYEIGCYALGAVEISLTKEEIERIRR